MEWNAQVSPTHLAWIVYAWLCNQGSGDMLMWGRPNDGAICARPFLATRVSRRDSGYRNVDGQGPKQVIVHWFQI